MLGFIGRMGTGGKGLKGVSVFYYRVFVRGYLGLGVFGARGGGGGGEISGVGPRPSTPTPFTRNQKRYHEVVARCQVKSLKTP